MNGEGSLAAAVESDLVAHVSRLYEPVGEVHREAGDVWFVTGDRSPYRNGILRARIPERHADQTVERLMAPFDEWDLAMMWWVFTPPEPLPVEVDRALRGRGFVLDADLPGMAVDLTAVQAPSAPEGGEVHRVIDEDMFRAWSHVVVRAFGDEDEDFEASLSARAFRAHGFGDDAPFRHFLYRLQGKWVGASTLSVGAGFAGLANIAVVPEHRRRGIGGVIAAAALLDGRQHGLRAGVLSAGELGLPLYERLGFREVSRHRTYVLRHTTQGRRVP